MTESYSVPAPIQSALASGCRDLSFTIAINVPTNQTGNYLLDNLQLGGAPTVVSCQSTIGATLEGGNPDIDYFRESLAVLGAKSGGLRDVGVQ